MQEGGGNNTNSKNKFDSAEEIKAYCIGYRDGVVNSQAVEGATEFAEGIISALNHVIDAIED